MLIILAFVVLIVFGVGFAMNAAAHAKQAQATIEVAQVAQVQSINNLISILVLSVLILVLALIVVGGIVLALRYLGVTRARKSTRQYVGPIIDKPVIEQTSRHNLPVALDQRMQLDAGESQQPDPAEELFDLDLLKWLER
ncbi:MAG TPA: hypothetical protein DCS05_03985 [Nitrospiraceae bacterium]|nr:hypothetical protein [Nitrospiraceae bacterium]